MSSSVTPWWVGSLLFQLKVSFPRTHGYSFIYTEQKRMWYFLFLPQFNVNIQLDSLLTHTEMMVFQVRFRTNVKEP